MSCTQAGRFSGSGARYCTRCADGTWSRTGSTFCLSANVGLVAPTGGHYSFVLDSALVLSGKVYSDRDNVTEQIGRAIYTSTTEYVSEFFNMSAVRVYDMSPSGDPRRRLVDSTTWFSNKDVQRNCSWVGAARDLVVQRCRVKGIHNERAQSACTGTCAGYAGRRLQDVNESTTVRFYVNATYDSSPAENASEIISLARLEFVDGLELWLLDAAQGELNGSLSIDPTESLRAIQSTSILQVRASIRDTTTNTTVCPPGKFSLAGQSTCEMCAIGFWNAQEKQATCKFAEAGHFVNVTGSSQQYQCPPGTISPGSAASECTCSSVSGF